MSRLHADAHPRRTDHQKPPPRRVEVLYRLLWRNPVITGVVVLIFFLILSVVAALVIAGMMLPPY
jgi:hypothetical protein